MFSEAPLVIFEPKPRGWAKRRASAGPDVRAENRHGKPPRARGSSKKRAARVPENGVRASRPEGWQRRLREQAHNLARALEMLEQAMAMTSEPKSHSLARAECLRGAGLLTLVAAAELLVVAGWYEADQAVSAGVLER